MIVDYKTDDIADDALKQRFQSYQEQGLWHYRAVREAARERVKDLLFFRASRGDPIDQTKRTLILNCQNVEPDPNSLECGLFADFSLWGVERQPSEPS